MKKITFENLVDQKKLLSHVFFLIIIILTAAFFSFRHRTELVSTEALFFLTLGFVQFELFIFIARLIFRKVTSCLAGLQNQIL